MAPVLLLASIGVNPSSDASLLLRLRAAMTASDNTGTHWRRVMRSSMDPRRKWLHNDRGHAKPSMREVVWAPPPHSPCQFDPPRTRATQVRASPNDSARNLSTLRRGALA